jgi:hypothetical protein
MDWLTANLDVVGAIASVVGTAIGLPALLAALVQLVRTKRAAEAAAAAAREAVGRIGSVLAVASLEQICSRSRDLLHLTRARDLSGSATAAFELREALAKFSQSKVAAQLDSSNTWTELLKSVGDIHDTLERAAAIRRIDAGRRESILQSIAEAHARFSMFAAVAGEKAGDIDAHP